MRAQMVVVNQMYHFMQKFARSLCQHLDHAVIYVKNEAMEWKKTSPAVIIILFNVDQIMHQYVEQDELDSKHKKSVHSFGQPDMPFGQS